MVFVILMKLAFFDPVKNTILKREDKIKDDLEKSQAAVAEVVSTSTESNPADILRTAKLEAQDIINAAVSQTNKERQAMVIEELKETKEQTQASMISLEKEQREILANLDAYVADLSKEAVDKLLAEIGAHATA